MSKRILLMTILFLSLIMIMAAYTQEDMEFVDNSSFNRPERAPSVFAHDEHNEKAGIEECNECHHDYDENGKKIEDISTEDQQCSECHSENETGRKPSLMKAFHSNCKGCHVREKKGPIMCGECHVNNPATGK